MSVAISAVLVLIGAIFPVVLVFPRFSSRYSTGDFAGVAIASLVWLMLSGLVSVFVSGGF